MQAQIVRRDEFVIVRLMGRVDVETAEPFRRACFEYLLGKKVIFDFDALSFVGSSGILPFLETMQEFALSSQGGFKFIRVGAEFRKIFSSTSLSLIEVYPDETRAIEAFGIPQAVCIPLSIVPRDENAENDEGLDML